MKKVYLHGEVTIVSGASIPEKAKRVDFKGQFILANSETTGNHHVLVAENGVDVYEHEGTLFVHVEEEAQVKCVDETRHDTQTLPAGDYIVRRKIEYDHLTKTPRVVSD